MNLKLILFSSVITALIGAMLGLAATRLRPTPFASEFYQNLESRYALIGAGAGLVIGAGQEAVRQLKKQRDEEEAIAHNHHKHS